MKPRTLLILALLVGGLAAFIAFYERDLPSSDRRAELGKRALPFEADEVTAVAIEGPAGRIRLERPPAPEDREGDAGEEDVALPGDRPWKLVEPMTGRADDVAADQVVRDLTGLEKERTVEAAGEAAKELGLDPPRAAVVLEREGGEPVRLEIGDEVPGGTSRAVRLAGTDEVLVVAGTFWESLTKAPGDWRSHDLFTGSREKIERVTLEGGAGRVLLARRGEGFWLEAPLADRADAKRVDELLYELVGLRAQRFADEHPPLAEIGLEPPEGSIEVVLEGQAEPVRIALGQPVADGIEEPAEESPEGIHEETLDANPPRWARVGEQVVEVASKLSAALARPAGSWRSRSLVGLETWQVDAVTVTGGGSTTVLQRAEGEWERDGTTIEYTPVSDLLYALTDAEASELVTAEEAAARGAALATPELTVKLESGEGDAKQTETAMLYPAVGGGVPARAEGRDAVLWLTEQAAADIRAKVAAARTAEPVAESAEEAEEPAEDEPESAED